MPESAKIRYFAQKNFLEMDVDSGTAIEFSIEARGKCVFFSLLQKKVILHKSRGSDTIYNVFHALIYTFFDRKTFFNDFDTTV